MADPLSVTVSVLTLVGFGIQSTNSLLAVLQDFQKYPSVIIQLNDELKSLGEVLKSLETAISDRNYDFSILKRPVHQCVTACREFESLIAKCSIRTDGNKRSIRDWTKLKYHGNDLASFKTVLSSNKATIAIALCDANLRIQNVTLNALNEYKAMIQTTSCDLEVRLQEIDDKLRELASNSSDSVEAGLSLQEAEEDKKSVQQCLNICGEVSNYIDRLQPKVLQNISTPADSVTGVNSPLGLAAFAHFTTASSLHKCKEELESARARISNHLKDIEGRSRLSETSDPGSESQQETKQHLEQEYESLQRSIKFCEYAANEAAQERKNVFEDVLIDEDGNQMLVSTVGDLIFARNIKAGARSTQVLGQLSDTSLQQIMTRPVASHSESSGSQEKASQQFQNRFGAGRNLGKG